MGQVIAGLTVSLDGCVAGPDDRPGLGLGRGGEALHHWMFGAPAEGADEATAGPTGDDKAFLDALMGRIGAAIGGRTTYDVAQAWGGRNPWPVPFFILTHRPDPASADFRFVGSLEEAIEQARGAAGAKDVHLMGGADVIRQGLRAGVVDELLVSIAPVMLGGGKRLFEDFDQPLQLEQTSVLHGPIATHITYRVVR